MQSRYDACDTQYWVSLAATSKPAAGLKLPEGCHRAQASHFPCLTWQPQPLDHARMLSSLASKHCQQPPQAAFTLVNASLQLLQLCIHFNKKRTAGCGKHHSRSSG